MKKLFALLIAAALIFALAACGDSGKDDKSASGKDSSTVEATEAATEAETEAKQGGSVVGTWKNVEGEEMYAFNEDGTGVRQAAEGVTEEITYETADGEIVISLSNDTVKIIRKYSVDGDTLTLENAFGGVDTYTRSDEEISVATEVDPNKVVIDKAQLIGTWSFPGVEDYENLTFNDDGTGTYKNLDGNQYSFTYELTPETNQFNNGDEYINNMLKVSYDNGETEDIIIFFNDEDHLCFHNSDNGGYNGVMNFAEWAKI